MRLEKDQREMERRDRAWGTLLIMENEMRKSFLFF